MTILSNDQSITYTDGHPLEPCAICADEHTDIHDDSASQPLPICIYCTYDRRPEYQPSAYLGSA